MNGSRSAPESLTISAFARHSRLTIKALRLYDALGLLEPAVKDVASGYRYYAPSQLGRAHLIGLLRQLDMPLTRIAQVLELQGSEAADAIRRYWAEEERDQAAKRDLVQYLAASLLGEGAHMYQVTLRDVPEQHIVSIQRHTYAADLPNFIERGTHELIGMLEDVGLQQTGPSFVIYHGQVNDDSDGPVEICVPYQGGALQPRGEQRVRLEGAHREAFTTITLEQCRFPRILEAYDAVQSFIQEQPLRKAGSPREVYFTTRDGLQPDDAFCDIAWPVR